MKVAKKIWEVMIQEKINTDVMRFGSVLSTGTPDVAFTILDGPSESL